MKDKKIQRTNYQAQKTTEFIESILTNKLTRGCLEKIEYNLYLLLTSFGRLCNVLCSKGLITASELIYIVTGENNCKASFEE